MRKTPQLREVLPIYPAMPFSPLARFAAAGAIRTVGKGNLPFLGGGRKIRRQTGNKMERIYPTKGLDMIAAPPFRQHCTGPDKGQE